MERISTSKGLQAANLVQFGLRHNNCGELLGQVGPTASSITEGNLSTHERWYQNRFVCQYHLVIGR